MPYLEHPKIDPVIFRLWGPFQIRWYSVLFVGGFLVGRSLLRRLSKEARFLFTAEDMDQLVLWLLIGSVIGARIFYCFVYDPRSLMADPFYLFQIYRGGLSFHGALIGVIIAAIVFSRKKGIPFWNLADAMALSTPTGLAMGRLGNFINGELFGRPTTVPWGMVFRGGGPSPRHPSQLYELMLEGVILFAVLWLLKSRLKRDGQISICFLVGYSICRFIAESFREPDVQVGYLALGLSMGQWLSLIMAVLSAGVGILVWNRGELRE